MIDYANNRGALRFELAAVLVIKLIALTCLWFFFINNHTQKVDPLQVNNVFFSENQ